ncbi:TPA: hypothetical protein HA235_02805 [Candidatus Woesearchaeota archaeon]|nr:glycosyltransferase family 39 protein [Candidatus Woesearchaeota archaeon]HIH31614.1 hypothetical protein [Candidatus Woesearchaeota archaeon]HIH55346.1 hypothetical protein [Candidatus Woesearchaeota archaeon]HIJ01184.1 hypothetical protein [Candidatus Woesearchaeota archaeon]HIJ14008.1 hypothetical protein [Candidatus Woesearchaeota archaeon]
MVIHRIIQYLKSRDILDNKKLLITLGVLLIILLSASLSNMLLWDETVYLGNARSYIGESNYVEDYRPPLLELVISLIWLFTGESVIVAKIMMILISLGSFLILFSIGKRYLSENLNYLMSVLFALTPIMLYWSAKIYTDIPSTFLVLISFYFILKDHDKSKKSDSNKLIIFAGIFAALALMMRYVQVIYLLCIIFYFLSHKRIKITIIFCLSVLIVLSPWIIYNQITYSNPLWDFMQQFTYFQEWNAPEPALKQVINLFIYVNPLIPLLLVIGFVILLLKKEKMKKFLIPYMIISLFYYVFYVNVKDPRYYLSFLPFIFLLSFYALENLMKNKSLRYVYNILLIVLIFSGLALMLNAFKTESRTSYCDKDNSIMQTIGYLNQEINDNNRNEITIISNSWPWYGYHLNVKAFSIWDSDISNQAKEVNADYVVYNNIIGQEYSKDTLDKSPALTFDREFHGNCNDKSYLYRVNQD